jgi:alanyl-tRNA synthetase
VLREAADRYKQQGGSAVVVLASAGDGAVRIIAAVTKDRTDRIKAGDVVNAAAAVVGGKGGGRPDMAQAGGTDVDRLPEALEKARAFIRERLAG